MGYICKLDNVIAQTVLIYIICVSVYLRVLSSGARASVSDLSVSSAWSAHQSYLIIRSSIYIVYYPLTDKFSCDRDNVTLTRTHVYRAFLIDLYAFGNNFFTIFFSQLSYLETFVNIVMLHLPVFRVSNEISRLWKITKRTRDWSSPNRGSKWPWKRPDTPTNRQRTISVILYSLFSIDIAEKIDTR